MISPLYIMITRVIISYSQGVVTLMCIYRHIHNNAFGRMVWCGITVYLVSISVYLGNSDEQNEVL